MSDVHKKPVLMALVVIVNKEKTEKVVKWFQSRDVTFLYQFRAQGTASSEVLDWLGIGHTDRSVILCIAKSSVISCMYRKISTEFRFMAPGTGLAFITRLSGIVNPMLGKMNVDKPQCEKKDESEVKKLKSDPKYALILAAINQGYSEDLMEAVKDVGARGGTVIHARNLGTGGPMKLWGISVQEEKEIVAIISTKEDKIKIMKAATQKCGLLTEARGVILSLPVDEVTGLNMDTEYEVLDEDEQ